MLSAKYKAAVIRSVRQNTGRHIEFVAVSCNDAEEDLREGIVELPKQLVPRIAKRIVFSIRGAHVSDPEVLHVLANGVESCRDTQIRDAMKRSLVAFALEKEQMA